MFRSEKLVLVTIGLIFLSCNGTSHRPLSIDFSADSTSIVISQINDDALLHLKKGIQTDTIYQKLVSVLQTPAEDDSTSMEIEWPGKLRMNGNMLIFTPDSGFKKGKSYLVETIINSQFATAEEILKSDVGHKVKLQQKILKR